MSVCVVRVCVCVVRVCVCVVCVFVVCVCCVCVHVYNRSSIIFSILQEYREYARGRGKSSCTLTKVLVLSTVPVQV